MYQNFARAEDVNLGEGVKIEKAERYLMSENTMAEFPLVIELDAATTNFKSTITDGMQAGLVFDLDRFSAESIGDLGARWVTVLEQIFDSGSVSTAPLGSFVPLLPREVAELCPMIRTATPAPAAGPDHATVLDLIQQVATETPQRTALSHNGQKLSYANLYAQAVAVAQALGKHNLQKDDVVCICMDRSFGLVVAMLGVQIAGAA